MLAMLSTTTAAQGPLVAVAATKHGDEQRDAGHKPRDRRGVLEDGRVVLNEATDEDLRRLPGIGPARAAKIMALRDRLGRFRSFRQLLQVRGIGPRTLHKLEPRMVLNAPPNDAGQADGEPEKKR
jgi:competence protein ComEA